MTHQCSIPTSRHTTTTDIHLKHISYMLTSTSGVEVHATCVFVLILSCPDANIQQSLVLLRPLSQRSSSARCLYLFRLPRSNTTLLPSTSKTSRVIAFVLFQPAPGGIFALHPVHSLGSSLFSHHFLPVAISSCFWNMSVFFLCLTRQCVLQSLSTFLFWLLPSALYVFQ